MGHPTIYPTGTTLFNKHKSFNGYTLFNAPGKGALLIDMNGNEVHLWQGLKGFPNKLLPGGYVLGSRGLRSPKYGMQDQLDLVQLDWQGNVVWSFNQLELIKDPDKPEMWMARQHHDYQREGNPVGYYSPELTSQTLSGNTLLLCHRNVSKPNISDKILLDDIFIEVDWEGNIIWEWCFSDHFDELNFSPEAKNAMFNDPNMRKAGGGMGDYLHINTMSKLGDNRHYNQGDNRFHPDNIIWDSREANIVGITCRQTGDIVWQIGPDYANPELSHIGWIIGPHHAHLIPRGLPGAGNILIFDNGGWAGYGSANPVSISGLKNARRDSSRVLEIDPVTLEIVWQHSAENLGFAMPMDASRFYSPYVSSAQRLPNGNTLITEGSDGRLIEITNDHQIVWEYVSPYWREGSKHNNMIYRAYRVPYEWIPQLKKPEEINIDPIDVNSFRMPNAAPKNIIAGVHVAGIIPDDPDNSDDVLCIASSESLDKSNNYKQKLFNFNSKFKHLKVDEFAKTIASEQLILVLFGAEWCAKCEAINALLPEILKEFPLHYHYYLSIDENTQNIVEQYNIKGIPTLILFKQGKAYQQISGVHNKDTLRSFFSNLNYD